MRACVDFHIELETVDPSSNWFVLNRASLDSDRTLGPTDYDQNVDGTVVLDKSLLDSTDELLEALVVTQPGYIWQKITSTSTYVDVRRGVDMSRGITSRPYAGTMTVRVIDPYLDALANQYVGIGTKARLRVGTQVVFLGHTTNLRTEYDAVGVPTLYLTASDAIARLNSVAMPARTAESYAQRVAAVANAAGIYYSVTGAGQNLTVTNDEKTALETLFAAQDSEGSLIWMDATNQLRALQRGEEAVGSASPAFTFSNDHTYANHICLTAFATSMDTEQVINQLTFNNLEWDGTQWATVPYVYGDSNSAAYYGVRKQSVSTTLDPNTLPNYAQQVFNTYSEAQRKVKQVAFKVSSMDDATIPGVTFIDIGDVVRVYLNDPANTALDNIAEVRRVGEISHRITPTLWDTQLTLL